MAKSVSDQHILDAALKTIVEHGYSGATTRQIAENAGINEVTLFRRFGNKKNILLAAVECQVEGFASEGIQYTGDLEADLTRILTAHGKFSKSKGKLFPMLMAELHRQPELAEVLQKPYTAITKVLEVIQRYQDEDSLVQEDPLHTLASLLGPLVLIEMMVDFHGPSITAPLNIQHQVKTFLQGHSIQLTEPEPTI